MASATERCKTCEFSPCRCEDLASGFFGNAHRAACWPLVSDAMAVHPSQAKEAHALAQKLGVPTDFTKAGQPIFSDANHRKRFCEAHGFYDRNGGYSDPQRRNRDRPQMSEKEFKAQFFDG